MCLNTDFIVHMLPNDTVDTSRKITFTPNVNLTFIYKNEHKINEVSEASCFGDKVAFYK